MNRRAEHPRQAKCWRQTSGNHTTQGNIVSVEVSVSRHHREVAGMSSPSPLTSRALQVLLKVRERDEQTQNQDSCCSGCKSWSHSCPTGSCGHGQRRLILWEPRNPGLLTPGQARHRQGYCSSAQLFHESVDTNGTLEELANETRVPSGIKTEGSSLKFRASFVLPS